MAAPARHTSLFSAGMVGDVDESLQPDASYRDARNLRLLYNTAPGKDGVTAQEQATQGKSLSLELIPGTTLATMLPDGYRVLGKGVTTSLGLIVFSTNGAFCEIGRIRRNPWSYQTLFNDQLDPNGERLHLFKGDRLQALTLTENLAVCRIYWVDNYHGTRVLNLHLGFDPVGLTYHQSGTYPKHWSVHQMDAQPSLVAARMRFESRIGGSLLSGAYQLTFRYRTKDGHPSPWAPLSLPVWVMDQALPVSDVVPNHHRRYFGSAGVETGEGLRFSVSGLDSRWSEIEVALLYHSAGVGAERARIVKIAPTSADLVIDITQFVGTAVTLDEFKTDYQTLTRVGTIGITENVLYQGNVAQQLPLTIDTAKFSASLTSFDFCADTTGEVKFNPKPNPANASRQDGDKLTNTARQTTTLPKQRYTSKSGAVRVDNLTVNDDYVNFKGQQVQHSFRGYRRGETYGFGAVCRDEKGNKYFVQPLGEITMPSLAQYSTSHYDSGSGQWLLRSLGVVLSGIRIPYSVAYYPDGRRRLSSIEIVRTQASGRIGFQGVILPCTTNTVSDDAIEEDKNQKKIEPAVAWNNGYSLQYQVGGGAFGHKSAHRSAYQTGEDNADIHPAEVINKSYWATLHAPDILISGKLPQKSDATRLQLVGSAHKSTQANEIILNLAGPSAQPDPCLMAYTKTYKVNAQALTGGDSYGRATIGSFSRIRTWFLHDQLDNSVLYEKVDPDDAKAKFNPNQNFYPNYTDPFAGTTQRPYRPSIPLPPNGDLVHIWADSILQLGAVVTKTQDWEAVDVIEALDSYVSMNLVNLVGPPTLTTPPDEWVYQSTGTVLEFTDEVLADLPTETDNAGNILFYVLNGMHVYGGNTYVNLFDFAQLYPRWEINCNRRMGYTADYGVGRIVPIESDWNIALRGGRSFANNAFFPQATACDNEVPHATAGIAWNQAEDWNMAAVLRPLETINLYSPQPRGTLLVDERPFSIYNSEVKTYGEREDAFRKQLRLNYSDLDGTKGEIMMLATLFDGLYCWQKADFGRVRTFERGLIPSTAGELITGTGKALDGVAYIGEGLGLQQFSAFIAEPGHAYWVDVQKKVICRFSQAGKDELSERERGHDLLKVLMPTNPADLLSIELTINPNDKEVWISWAVKPHSITEKQIRGTLVYTEALDLLSGWSDLLGQQYLLFNNTLLASDPAAPHRIHETGTGLPCQFFGVTYPAYVTWVVNPAPKNPKKFDNAVIAINADGRKALTFLEMVTATDRQTMDLRPGRDEDVEYWRNVLMLPLLEPNETEESKTRLWGNTLRLTLRIDPALLATGERLTLLSVETIYRLITRH